MATNAEMTAEIEAFKIANSHDDTNFSIKLGDYQWRVHSKLLAERSGFFRAMCNGNFKEADARDVELHDHDPWDFARFLQYAYTGNLDIRDSAASAKLPLHQIMHQGKSQGQGDFTGKEVRSTFHILSAMFHLANYFDCPDLADTVATNLVEEVTKIDDNVWTDQKKGSFSFEMTAQHYTDVFGILHPFFRTNPKMVQLETRMVEFLVAAKIILKRQNGDQILPILTSRPQYTSHHQEMLQKFLVEIEECMDKSPSFPKKYAKAMEEVVDKTLLLHDEYAPRLKPLMPHSFLPHSSEY